MGVDVVFEPGRKLRDWLKTGQGGRGRAGRTFDTLQGTIVQVRQCGV